MPYKNPEQQKKYFREYWKKWRLAHLAQYRKRMVEWRKKKENRASTTSTLRRTSAILPQCFDFPLAMILCISLHYSHYFFLPIRPIMLPAVLIYFLWIFLPPFHHPFAILCEMRQSPLLPVFPKVFFLLFWVFVGHRFYYKSL